MQTDRLKTDLEFVTLRRPLVSGDTMLEVMARLDAAARSADTPDRMKHYLSKRSYLKALDFIENPQIPHQL